MSTITEMDNTLKKPKQNKIVLIRGISGSGKSTLAELFCRLNPSFKHFEVDMFFIQRGKYRFNPKFLPDAHKWCFSHTKEALSQGHSVIVSNTFTMRWQLDKYLKLPYPKTIIKCTGNYQNQHGVPNHVIDKMLERWEDIEGEISF